MRPSKQMPEPERLPRILDLARCLEYGASLGRIESYPGCERLYPASNGVLTILDALRGRNRIAANFYDGPGWIKFRRWERMFLKVQGGEARARWQILRHLTSTPFARVLEVGIGDGPAREPVWYRGHSRAGYMLRPSLYRAAHLRSLSFGNAVISMVGMFSPNLTWRS